MRIEHLAIFTLDLEGMCRYYARYFGAQVGELYHNKSTGFRSHFLTFDEGARLELMTRPSLEPLTPSDERAGIVHLAMSVGSRETVDALTETLRTDGYAVYSEPRTTGDGYYESCVSDPDGNRVEITI